MTAVSLDVRVVDNNLELLIEEPSSNSRWVRYIQLRANSLGKGMDPPLILPATGLICKICVT